MPRTDKLVGQAGLPVAIKRNDAWGNVVSSLGTAKDKRRHLRFTSDVFLQKETLCEQYIGDGLVSRIIDAIPEDMTREWGYFEGDTENERGEGIIAAEFVRLDAPTIFREAKKWSRLLGGSLIYIGAMGSGRPETPLNPTKIKNIEFLKVIELGDIYTNECVFDEDPTSPTFGQIIFYKVRIRVGTTFQDYTIHASRCIPVFGRRVPLASSSMLPFESRYWGIPIMQFIYNDLKDFRSAFGSTSAILNEFIIGKYKFSDLDEMLSQGNEKALQTRIDAIDQTKSIINSVILGTDEEYTRDSATVTGISDLLDRFMMNLSAVSGIPVTKLFGRSASGLNATGEGDSKNYYDTVKSEQNELTPYIQRLGKVIADWKNVDTDIVWKWNPLFQLTEEQKANKDRIEAENFRTLADGDQKYIQDGVLTEEEVYKLRFEALLGKKKFEDFDPTDLPMPGLNPDGTPFQAEPTPGKEASAVENAEEQKVENDQGNL